MDEPRLAEIQVLVEPILADRQMELVELSTRPQAGQQLIRLLVDKVGGVTVEQCAQVNRRIGEALEAANCIAGSYMVEVLLDDRDQSPGSKLKDADLIGIPLQVVIGKVWKAERKLEIVQRKTKEKLLVEPERLADAVHKLLDKLSSLS